MFSSIQCPFCDKVFSRTFNLRRHLENNSCKMNPLDNEEDHSMSEEEYEDETNSEDFSGTDDSDSDSSEDSDSDVSDSDDYQLPWYWKILVDEALDRIDEQKQQMVEELLTNGNTEQDAKQKASDELLPLLKKELRQILTKKLEWMHAMKHDSYFRKIIKTRQELMNTGEYKWREATKLAIHQRKFLLDEIIPSSEYVEQFIDQYDKTDTME